MIIKNELTKIYGLIDNIVWYGRGWRKLTDNTNIYFNPKEGYLVIEMNLENRDQYYFKIHGNKIVHKFKSEQINDYHWRKVRNGILSIGLSHDLYEQNIFIEDHIDMTHDDYKILMMIYYSLKDDNVLRDIYN